MLSASVSFVLHAHLPWVRAEGPSISLEEGWLYEAMWQSYLPLFEVLSRLADPRPASPLCTLSLSPPLLSMLGDAHHQQRFRRYADELSTTFVRAAERAPEHAAAIADHKARLDTAVATFERLRGDLVAGFVDLDSRHVVELATTAASHAFLPGVLSDAAARAQIRMGLRYFHALTKRHARVFWLPECGYDERLENVVVESGALATVLASHGIDFARPRPPFSTHTPILGAQPFAFFGRAAELVDRIWSREHGYPAHPSYREFHHPLEAGASPSSRALKPFRITGEGQAKETYAPEAAALTSKQHAADFLAHTARWFQSRDVPHPIAVLAFDAELFGHWWWEGPAFLEAVLAGAKAHDLSVCSLSSYLERDPPLPVARPATSTWGRGGYADAWAHPSSSHASRLAHRGERRVLAIDALVRDTPRSETQRRARLWAIRELFLLQASDYAFMLRSGEFAAFAQKKLLEHASRLDELCAIAERAKEAEGDKARVHALVTDRPFFSELDEDAWADAFDPW
jgi:1,4-alpha-glucan branching enzyme